MYAVLRRWGDFLKNVDPLWQNILNVVLLGIFAGALVIDDPRLQHAQTFAVVFAPLLFILSATIQFMLRRLRRPPIDPDEVTSAFSAFRGRQQFAQLFGGAVVIRSGCVEVERAIPAFGFMRKATTDADIAEVSRINVAAFESSVWAGSFETKMARNRAIWQRNPHTFWVIDPFALEREIGIPAAETATPFFFSFAIPLTETGFRRYFVDQVAGDNDFRADWVAADGEQAHSLLMFAIGRDRARAARLSNGRPGAFLPYYLRCVAVHLEDLARRHFAAGTDATVYFQNDDDTFASLANLAGMDQAQLRSMDNEQVYVTSLRVGPPGQFAG